MKLRLTIYHVVTALAASALLTISIFAQAGRFAVQLGASPDRAEAEARLQAAKAQGLQAYLVKSTVSGKGIFYRVRVGNFPSRAAAEQYAQGLKSKGTLTEYFVALYEAPEAETPPATTTAPAPATTVAVVPATPKPTATPTPAPVIAKTPPVTATPTAAANKGMPAITAPPTTKPAVTTTAPATSAAVTKPATATPPASSAPAMTKPAATTPSPTANAATPTKPAGTTNNVATVLGGYTTFQDQSIGYSFEHPSYWVGGALGSNEVQTQKYTGGATFKSNEDTAFLNAIWNKLDKANSGEHDNDMIVNLILKSMSSGSGIQSLSEVNRNVVTEGQQIKTFLDLKAAFQVPNLPSPLDFIGKGVIIRASKGILLVVTFYAKDAPQTVAMTADHIIKTARTPE